MRCVARCLPAVLATCLVVVAGCSSHQPCNNFCISEGTKIFGLPLVTSPLPRGAGRLTKAASAVIPVRMRGALRQHRHGGVALAAILAIFTFARGALALDKQGSAHGGAVSS